VCSSDLDPNVGVVGVPDARLAKLAEIFSSAKIVPAKVEFVDIAGLVRGASEGQGRGNQFLANIRETDAICQVIRVFRDPDVSHVDGEVSPERDIETINTELILADLQTLEKALPRLTKEAKANKDRKATLEAVEAAAKVLGSGTSLDAGAQAAGIDLAGLRQLRRRPAKPFLDGCSLDADPLVDTVLRERLCALVAPA